MNVDLLWRNMMFEFKSTIHIDSRSLEQLRLAVRHRDMFDKPLVYIFANTPSPSAKKKLKAVSVPWITTD